MEMQQFFKSMMILAMGFMLVACSDSGTLDSNARLDTSSKEALETSLNAMTAGMSNAEEQKVAAAFAGIMMIRGFEMMGQDLTDEEAQARMMEGLHGLTAAELVAKAEELAAELEAKQ